MFFFWLNWNVNCYILIKKLAFVIERTETVQTYNLGYNNDIFQKNAFLNLKTLLKDIFEKCWHERSCVVKMNSLSDLSIVQSDYILYFYFAYVLNNITITLKMSLKNHNFLVHLQKTLTSSSFYSYLDPKKCVT